MYHMSCSRSITSKIPANNSIEIFLFDIVYCARLHATLSNYWSDDDFSEVVLALRNSGWLM
jgi:hypothetical protein